MFDAPTIARRPHPVRIGIARIVDAGTNLLAMLIMIVNMVVVLNAQSDGTTVAAASFDFWPIALTAVAVFVVLRLSRLGLKERQWKTPVLRVLDVVSLVMLVPFAIIVPGFHWMLWLVGAAGLLWALVGLTNWSDNR
jgi:hypothetical protein